MIHLLCAPFPSPQGTQAAVAAMLRAERQSGLRPRLLAYAEGYGSGDPTLEVERLPELPFEVGPRSGPSFARALHDALAAVVLFARREPELVFAHNVEAAVACALAGVDYVYVAHTSMRDELPSYGAVGPLAGHLGALLDRAASSRAIDIAAIVPDLRAELESRLGREVSLLPVPWESAAEVACRDEARRALSLHPDSLVLLHAGNLDAYQGLDTLVDVARELGRSRRTTLLVATASEGGAFRRRLRDLAIDHRFVPLSSEEQRSHAHAAADVALVARNVPYGLPIKLLEALSRGVPLVCTRMAAAGLPLGDAAIVVPEASVTELASACMRASTQARDSMVREGHAYLREHHGLSSFRRAEETIVELAEARRLRSFGRSRRSR